MSSPFGLIIEDDEDLAMIFEGALTEANFDTEVISDGQAALTRLAEIVPDVIVLDLHLPHVSGGNILHQIRADERLANTRVMLATADAIRAEGLRNEADLVLLKPISFGQLTMLAARMHPSHTP